MKTFLTLAFVLGAKAVFSQEKAKPYGKVIIDNDQVKVTELVSLPGKDLCGLGKHTHPAHLTVMLTDATVTVTTPTGKAITQKVPAGTTMWSEAETHTVINSGSKTSKVQIIEYKKK
ncbi:MAG: hypothetical protein JST48_06260 [Bacteroidetes bacterium]|nr:hypothetical protein [Bacteroidota bacterium]